jgi:hypothetical protein
MYAPVHVMCVLQRGVSIEYGIYSPDVIEYTEALARKDWPRFRDPFDIPSPRVEDGRIYPGETGFHWYANFPGNTKVTFQYVVDVVENDDISTPMASLPGVCGDTCPTFETIRLPLMDSVCPIDEDGKLQTRFRLPNSTSTEPMFYTVSRTKSNTLRMEITLNTLTYPTVRSDCGLMDCWSKRIYGYCTGITTIYLSDRCHFKPTAVSH